MKIEKAVECQNYSPLTPVIAFPSSLLWTGGLSSGRLEGWRVVPLKILGLKLSLNNFNGVHSTALVVISFLCLPVGLSDVLSHSFCFPLNDQYDLFFSPEFSSNFSQLLCAPRPFYDPRFIQGPLFSASKSSHWPKTELPGFLLHGNISTAHRKVPEGTSVRENNECWRALPTKITTSLSKLSLCRACLCRISGWLRTSKFLLHTAAPTSTDWACVNTYHNYTVKTFLGDSRAFRRRTVIWLWMYLQPKFKISIV